jgi:hypothetical protein
VLFFQHWSCFLGGSNLKDVLGCKRGSQKVVLRHVIELGTFDLLKKIKLINFNCIVFDFKSTFKIGQIENLVTEQN